MARIAIDQRFLSGLTQKVGAHTAMLSNKINSLIVKRSGQLPFPDQKGWCKPQPFAGFAKAAHPDLAGCKELTEMASAGAGSRPRARYRYEPESQPVPATARCSILPRKDVTTFFRNQLPGISS